MNGLKGLGVDGRYPSSKIPELSMIFDAWSGASPVDRTVSPARLIPRTDGSAPDAVQPIGKVDYVLDPNPKRMAGVGGK